MSQTMKLGLALSGGGAIGAYEAGVVKALAESGTDVHMVSGASIGALNGAIIASSSGLSQAAERMAVEFICMRKAFRALYCRCRPAIFIPITALFTDKIMKPPFGWCWNW